jgi:hypothetical protein
MATSHRSRVVRIGLSQVPEVPMISAIVGVGLLSYLAGVVSFRVKSRWCRECGATTRCPECKLSAHV